MTDKLNALITLRDKVKVGGIERYQSTLPLVRQWRSPLEYFEITDYIEAASNGSLDSALFLIDAVLPEWFWCRYADGTFYLEQKVWPVGSNCLGVSANHEIPSRALLLAILDALIAMERNQSLVMRPKESE